jgi:hypothetical protein
VAGLVASLAILPASTANALQDSHESGITYSGTWSTVANSSAIGGSYAGASMAVEDATGSPGSKTPSASLTFIPAASSWTLVTSSAASGGSYMSAPNDGAPVVLVEETGTSADGLRYANESTWWQGAATKITTGVAATIEDTYAGVIYRYTDPSNNTYDCTAAEISSGTDTCNGAFLAGASTTYTQKNLPNDHHTSIELPFTGSNVTAVFSIGTSRGKVDIEVRRASDNAVVRSTTGFDTSTTSKAAFWGMAHDAYKLVIKGTGLQGATTPQGYTYYFHYARVYPSIEYEFFGPSISYEGVKGPDYGKANIYIDGIQEDGDADTPGAQPIDFYNASTTWTTLFSNTRDGTVTSSLRYANGGNKHRILIEASGEKNPASTGYRLALDKFRALPSISGFLDVPAGGSLNIATPAHSNQGVWKLFVDGQTPFSVDNNTPGDKELNMYFGGGFTLRNFRVTGLSPGSREFSLVSKWYGRDPSSTANKVMFDGIANATASYTFTGTTVAYVARRGPDQGRVKVFIDGVEQDADSAAGAVQPFDLYAATEQLRQPIFTVSSLTNAQHTIRIEQEGTKHAASTGTGINLDAFQTTMSVASTFNVVTNGAYHMAPFTIGGTQYIAISNHRDLMYSPTEGWNVRYNTPDTKVYKLDPATGLTLVAALPTSGALGVEHFAIGTDHYLAVANYTRDEEPLGTYRPGMLWAMPVHIYKWYPSQNNGSGGFDSDVSAAGVNPFQSLNAYGPTDMEFFEEGGEKYLAIGSYFEHSSTWNNGYTEIFRWSSASGSFNTQFVQRISVKGVNRITHFRIAGELYLGIASSNGSSICKWGATANGGNPGCASHQSMMAASDMEVFTIDGLNYAALLNTTSKIYPWNAVTGLFDTNNPVQPDLPGSSDGDFEYVQYGANRYLVKSGTSVSVYKWNGTGFAMESTLSNFAKSRRVEHFFFENRLYLGVAENFQTPQNSTVSSSVFLFQ